jgi:hypothetical protein
MGGNAVKRTSSAGAFGCIFVALLLVLAGPAAATWVQSTTPTITGERGSGFGGVACPGAHVCIAVGSYADSASHSHVLAEGWDGSTWTTQPTTDPFNSASAGLNSVSCPTTTACVAVGSYFDSGGTMLPLADVWDGSAWTLWGPSLPAAAVRGDLLGVRCPSATSCFAVGTWTDASNVTTELAEHWDAGSWTVEPTPTPSGATSSELDGIACPAPTQCIAVGTYRDATNNSLTLAGRWNGTAWSILPTPNPTGSTSNQLSSIACTSTTHCTAVGSGFAAGWNGTTWTLQTIVTPRPHTGGPAVLVGVSCRGALCAAVGYYERDAVETVVVENWDGQKWVLGAASISSPNDSSVLNAVSCRSPTSCMAAGSFHNSFFNQDHTLAESFSLTWQQQTFPDPGPSIGGSVDDVSCPSMRFCAAVGSFETSADFETYAETWDGGQWIPRTVPNPATTNLTAVSCSTATACTAVGNGGDAINGFVTLAERWDGANWTVQSTPNHAGGGQGTYFTGVSCPNNISCTAVGAYRDASGHQFPYAARWNGSTWVATNAPNPTGATNSELNRVSCTSGSACVAVGGQGPSSPTALAEVWNGTSWTIHNPSFGANLTSASFSGVSCLAPTSCIAVGSVFSTAANRRFALAERWDGTAWTDTGALVRGGTKTNFLEDVSCVAADDCMAVGTSSTSAPGRTTLTETWNGTQWTLLTAPNPGGTMDTTFSAVSCSSRLLCIGTGYYSQSNGNDTFLAEQYS